MAIYKQSCSIILCFAEAERFASRLINCLGEMVIFPTHVSQQIHGLQFDELPLHRGGGTYISLSTTLKIFMQKNFKTK